MILTILLFEVMLSAGAAKGSRLGKHPEYVYKPPVPSSLSEIGEREREGARVCADLPP